LSLVAPPCDSALLALRRRASTKELLIILNERILLKHALTFCCFFFFVGSSWAQDAFFLNLKETKISVAHAPGDFLFEQLIPKEASLTFLDEFLDDEGILWFRIGMEGENHVLINGDVDFWVRQEELSQLSLIEDSVLRMTYCYRYVKKYLLAKGLVSSYLPGSSAYMAAQILPKYGFKKMSRSPSQAIAYDVCVYRGGPAGNGHIEVLDPKGWYYGYGYKNHPIAGRIFIGCFHKI